MPRKRNEQSENYHKAFPTALRRLMDEHKEVTQQILADVLGKSRQAISYYCDGSSSPDWETLVKIANFFSVSTDYLLGVSIVKNPDTSIRAVCEYTGLSPATAELLHAYASSGFTTQLIDAILQADGIPTDMPEAITDSAQALAVSLASRLSDLPGIQREVKNRIATISRNGTNEYYISAEHAADLYLAKAIEIATSNIAAVVRKMRNDLAVTVFDPQNDDGVSVEIEIIKVDESDIPEK